jgi:hypothetical protein
MYAPRVLEREGAVSLKAVKMLVAATLLLAACGGGGATTSQGDAPGEAGIDVGSVKAVDLPKGFPADLPLPAGAKPAFVSETSDGVGVWFASDKGVDELKTFFSSAFESSPWKVTWHTTVDEAEGTYSVYLVAQGNEEATVYVGNGGPDAQAYGQPYSFRVVLTKTA